MRFAGWTIRATAFEIQVLDDSTDETIDVAREIVERYARGFAGIGAAADRVPASDESARL